MDFYDVGGPGASISGVGDRYPAFVVPAVGPYAVEVPLSQGPWASAAPTGQGQGQALRHAGNGGCRAIATHLADISYISYSVRMGRNEVPNSTAAVIDPPRPSRSKAHAKERLKRADSRLAEALPLRDVDDIV
ncbi:MAG: hypothetical protein JWR30_3762, partial [Conexibacter sp.]|nr:hypothetical protein [Conexibacter sp.]